MHGMKNMGWRYGTDFTPRGAARAPTLAHSSILSTQGSLINSTHKFQVIFFLSDAELARSICSSLISEVQSPQRSELESPFPSPRRARPLSPAAKPGQGMYHHCLPARLSQT
ncbi:unnamed protein product [Natator depressus]